MITLLRVVENVLMGATKKLSPDDKNLLKVAEDGDLASVKTLLEQGADIESRYWYGKTPLFLAVTSENPEVLNFLLAAGASVNVHNQSGQTPLHRARSGETVHQLLAWGTDIDAKETGQPLSKSVPLLPLKPLLPVDKPQLKDYVYEPLMGKLIFD